MTRYQIKVPDGDLTDLVHELTHRIISRATSVASIVETSPKTEHEKLYRDVFGACKTVLQRYVRGFHVCGCRPHCDAESAATDLRSTAKARPGTTVARYVLSLEVPLAEFAKEIEVEAIRAVAGDIHVKNWKKLLLPIVKDAVEPTLGKYVSYSPTCNRGEYICTVGVCTEFDPWERIAPRPV